MIDVVLLLVMLGYVVSGFRQGLLVGVLSLGGFVGGAVLAMFLAPELVGNLQPGTRRSIIVLLAVILTAWMGQFIGALLGGRLRDAVPQGPVAVADHVVGALSGLVAVALVIWFVAGAVRGGPSPLLSRTVASSRVIQAIDKLVPTELVGVADTFRSAVGSSTFPRVFAGVGPEDIIPVHTPDPEVLGSTAVARARRSVVMITGDATSCGRQQEGSGTVVAPQRVVTNAHVVAGVANPNVQIGGVGKLYPARVVAFDPHRDLAILAVPQLPTKAIPLASSDLSRADSALVAGYPNEGPFRASAARVRSTIRASGEDIYGTPGVVREVYSLYVTVEPGNSGGPLLNSQGQLVGVVFARSLDDKNTGYALTLDEARSTILSGIDSTTPVSTGGCASG